jgi:glucose uptake protein
MVLVILPSTYAFALLAMLFSMLCWGSWANTMKLVPHYRFELFYWDYVGGILLVVLVLGLTFGTLGSGGPNLVQDLKQADLVHMGYGLAGGVVFYVANTLLVSAIAIAGMAVAFPIGIGLALVVGVLFNYLITPRGNPILLFGGVTLVCIAILLVAQAYRHHSSAPASSRRGIVLSLLSGICMGLFYPFVAKAISGENPLGPYAVAVVFAVGILICAIPLNYFLMRRPLTSGSPVAPTDYLQAGKREHLLGLLGGIIWGAGTTANFVASASAQVGPAIAYAIGQGATMVSAAWGVFYWREFAGASRGVNILLALMFVSFLLGLTAVSLAVP